jgi:hypothetical protein
MTYELALKLAKALLQECSFNPELFPCESAEDQEDKLAFLPDSLAEALTLFLDTLPADQEEVAAAIRRFESRPTLSMSLDWKDGLPLAIADPHITITPRVFDQHGVENCTRCGKSHSYNANACELVQDMARLEIEHTFAGDLMYSFPLKEEKRT